jgi:hypothetical protein
MRVLCLVAALLVASAVGTSSPVTKVVELIEELKAKIEADAISEQKIYDKYACWCETTTARKATAIEDAKVSIERLGHSVLSLKGKSATEGSEIAELNQDISDNNDAQAKATAIREKENGDYQANKAEMEQAIGALEKAVTVLSGAGTKGEFVQKEMSLLAVASGVRNAVQALPQGAKLAPTQLSLLSSFMKDPQDYYEDKAAAKSSYSPASTTIMGILKDMYDTFTANLETETQTEATNQKNFENVMAVKADELAKSTEVLQKTEANKAESDKQLADTMQELEDTTVQMKDDTKFFDETKAACKTKADDWSERTRLRTQELAGINKALEVLTSDDARALFNKAIKPGKETFLQLSEDVSGPEVRAFKALKSQAGKVHSLRLASLAASIRTANAGNFQVVIDEVEKMIQVLKDEEQGDIDQRDWCKETTFVKETEASRYAYKIEKTEAKITKLNEKKQELEDAIVATDAEILATQEEVAAMEAQRTADNGAFLQAKADDEAAAQLLGVAIGHLSAFYKNEDIDQGEIQGSINLLQKRQPAFDVSEDQAPDASFSSGDKSAGESKGIVSIMTMLKEDLEDEVKNGIKAEETAQTEFQRQRDAANKLIASLEEKKTNLNEAKADTDDKIGAAENLQSDTQKLLDGRNEELAEIKPNCDWILKNFELRRERRASEMEGLMDAQSLLSGSGGTVLVQTQEHKFPTFEGVSFLQKRQ